MHAMDWPPEEHQFNERPMIKRPPCERDLVYDMQQEAASQQCWTDFLTEEQKKYFDHAQPDRIRNMLNAAAPEKGVQWFNARSFDEWWEELTADVQQLEEFKETKKDKN